MRQSDDYWDDVEPDMPVDKKEPIVRLGLNVQAWVLLFGFEACILPYCQSFRLRVFRL